MQKKTMILVSACLLGEPCRYDGASKAHAGVMRLAHRYELIPVCPERLGGLDTPRERAERQGDAVVTEEGRDVTLPYVIGAAEAARIARDAHCATAVLKAKSPSCGSGQIYDGTFTGTLVSGDGIAAELFKKMGIRVLTEEEIGGL